MPRRRTVRTIPERIREIAEMIGGKDVSDSALIHAKSLLHS